MADRTPDLTRSTTRATPTPAQASASASAPLGRHRLAPSVPLPSPLVRPETPGSPAPPAPPALPRVIGEEQLATRAFAAFDTVEVLFAEKARQQFGNGHQERIRRAAAAHDLQPSELLLEAERYRAYNVVT